MSNAEHRPVSDTLFARLRFQLATLLCAAGPCVTQAASAQDASRNALTSTASNRLSVQAAWSRRIWRSFCPASRLRRSSSCTTRKIPCICTWGISRDFLLVGDRLTGDLGIAVGIPIRGTGRFQFGLSLPVTFWQTGEVGQLARSSKIRRCGRVCRAKSRARLVRKTCASRPRSCSSMASGGGLGFAGDLKLPTGDKQSFLGSPLPTGNLKLLFHGTCGASPWC